MKIAERLQQFEVFSHLTASQLDDLADCSRREVFPDGEAIVQEGEKGREAYLIDGGVVRIHRNTPYGLYTLAELERGQLFGETSFVDESGRSGDAVAKGDAAILVVNCAYLSERFANDRKLEIGVYWAFWKSLSQKLRTTNYRLAHFFSQASTTPAPEEKSASQTGEFQVGLNTKRDLFREQKLSPMEINFLASLSKVKRLGGGETIFNEGEPGDRMFVVLEGKVRISKMIAGAGEEALAILERGDYFGEMALIDREPRSADARAHKDGAVVLVIPRDVLQGILDIERVSSLRLLKLLCNLVAKRLREIDDKLISWYIFAAGSGQSLEAPDS